MRRGRPQQPRPPPAPNGFSVAARSPQWLPWGGTPTGAPSTARCRGGPVPPEPRAACARSAAGPRGARPLGSAGELRRPATRPDGAAVRAASAPLPTARDAVAPAAPWPRRPTQAGGAGAGPAAPGEAAPPTKARRARRGVRRGCRRPPAAPRPVARARRVPAGPRDARAADGDAHPLAASNSRWSHAMPTADDGAELTLRRTVATGQHRAHVDAPALEPPVIHHGCAAPYSTIAR